MCRLVTGAGRVALFLGELLNTVELVTTVTTITELVASEGVTHLGTTVDTLLWRHGVDDPVVVGERVLTGTWRLVTTLPSGLVPVGVYLGSSRGDVPQSRPVQITAHLGGVTGAWDCAVRVGHDGTRSVLEVVTTRATSAAGGHGPRGVSLGAGVDAITIGHRSRLVAVGLYRAEAVVGVARVTPNLFTTSLGDDRFEVHSGTFWGIVDVVHVVGTAGLSGVTGTLVCTSTWHGGLGHVEGITTDTVPDGTGLTDGGKLVALLEARSLATVNRKSRVGVGDTTGYGLLSTETGDIVPAELGRKLERLGLGSNSEGGSHSTSEAADRGVRGRRASRLGTSGPWQVATGKSVDGNEIDVGTLVERTLFGSTVGSLLSVGDGGEDGAVGE